MTYRRKMALSMAVGFPAELETFTISAGKDKQSLKWVGLQRRGGESGRIWW